MSPDRNDLFSLFREDPWESAGGPLETGESDWLAGLLFAFVLILLLSVTGSDSAASVRYRSMVALR